MGIVLLELLLAPIDKEDPRSVGIVCPRTLGLVSVEVPGDRVLAQDDDAAQRPPPLSGPASATCDFSCCLTESIGLP